MAHARPDAADVHEHERHAAARELLDQPQVHLRRHDRDAVHLALEHPAHAAGHARRLVVGAGEDQVVALFCVASASKLCTSSGKNGLVMSETISPSSRLRPDTSARAWLFG